MCRQRKTVTPPHRAAAASLIIFLQQHDEHQHGVSFLTGHRFKEKSKGELISCGDTEPGKDAKGFFVFKTANVLKPNTLISSLCERAVFSIKAFFFFFLVQLTFHTSIKLRRDLTDVRDVRRS